MDGKRIKKCWLQTASTSLSLQPDVELSVVLIGVFVSAGIPLQPMNAEVIESFESFRCCRMLMFHQHASVYWNAENFAPISSPRVGAVRHVAASLETAGAPDGTERIHSAALAGGSVSSKLHYGEMKPSFKPRVCSPFTSQSGKATCHQDIAPVCPLVLNTGLIIWLWNPRKNTKLS